MEYKHCNLIKFYKPQVFVFHVFHVGIPKLIYKNTYLYLYHSLWWQNSLGRKQKQLFPRKKEVLFKYYLEICCGGVMGVTWTQYK